MKINFTDDQISDILKEKEEELRTELNFKVERLEEELNQKLAGLKQRLLEWDVNKEIDSLLNKKDYLINGKFTEYGRQETIRLYNLNYSPLQMANIFGVKASQVSQKIQGLLKSKELTPRPKKAKKV